MTSDSAAFDADHGRQLARRAIDLRAAGDPRGAVSVALRALETFPSDAPPGLRGQAALVLGNALADLGEYDQAYVRLTEAAEFFREAGLAYGVVQCHISRGRVLAERGQIDEAIMLFEGIVDLRLTPRLRSQVLNNLALLNRRMGNIGEALRFLFEDVAVCGETGDSYGLAVAHYNLAGALSEAARPSEAMGHARQAADLFASLGRQDLADQARARETGG